MEQKPTLGDALIALVRTVVPLIVGWLLAHLALPAEVAPQIELILTTVFTALYYVAVRFLSARWSWVGWLLGYPTDPTYTPRHGK